MKRAWRRQAQAGFTLVEMMVVLALIALLAGLAGPSMMRWMDRSQADEGSRKILNTLREARDTAMNRGFAMAAKFKEKDSGGVAVEIYQTDARRCADVNAGALGAPVYTYRISEMTSKHAVMEAEPNPMRSGICFSPQGPILNLNNKKPLSYSMTGTGCNDVIMGGLIVIRSKDFPSSGAPSFDCSNDPALKVTADSRDERIIEVQYNGSVSLSKTIVMTN